MRKINYSSWRKEKFVRVWVLSLLLVFSASSARSADEWHQIGLGREINISGMALVENLNEQPVFIVIHDNKKKKQKRAGIIKISGGIPQYAALEWLGKEQPVDLEAIAAIPEKPQQFMAMTSAGKLYHIELDGSANSVKVINSFNVPSIPAGANLEAFDLQKIGDINLVVWAERGEDSKPATIFWGRYDAASGAFSQIENAEIRVPYPISNVRHISDIRVHTDGKIFISAAADPGNDGPFASAIYLLGSFSFDNPARINFTQAATLTPIFKTESRKIEAFEIVRGTTNKMVIGTDDENLGAAVYPAWHGF